MVAEQADGVTRSLGAPRDRNERPQGRCGHLAVRDEATTAGPAMTSAYFPTLEEIERIRHGAPALSPGHRRGSPAGRDGGRPRSNPPRGLKPLIAVNRPSRY